METKLTIRLKKKVIERAKDYALVHKISLSKMIESYLESITEPKKDDFQITPLVESLSGVIHLSDDFDIKKECSNYLTEKYIPEDHKEIVRNRFQKIEENIENCLSWEDIDR